MIDASPTAETQLSYTLRQAKRFRDLAQNCRDVARCLHFRPDRERVLEMARQHDADAARFETAVQD